MPTKPKVKPSIVKKDVDWTKELRRAVLKGKLKALDDGDLQPEQVTEIAERLEVPEKDVVDMNRRLSGYDYSLNNTYSLENDEEVKILNER